MSMDCVISRLSWKLGSIGLTLVFCLALAITDPGSLHAQAEQPDNDANAVVSKPMSDPPKSLESEITVASACPGSVDCSAAFMREPIAPYGNTGVGLAETQRFTMPHYVTAPDLDVEVAITKTQATLGQGSIFLSPAWWSDPTRGRYLMIVDDEANLVYYNRSSALMFDFKRQPNGLLSYFDASDNTFKVLDKSYKQVDQWAAGNGLTADLHDLQLLPNGNALLMIYDRQPLDLSSVGGRTDAVVVDLILQELDPSKNVVFDWNSRDHFAITDTYESLTGAEVDYVHGNAIEVDYDNNLLISSRNMSEITKIDRTTGNIIWRLGGKNNEFTFIGDPYIPGAGAFSYQHDIRRVANGNITLFDNGNQFPDAFVRGSRGVEYAIDETAKTATLVHEFRTTPNTVSFYMGNAQRLANGNTFVGWGGGYLAPLVPPLQTASEFSPDGELAMSLDITNKEFVSYRAFRFPWQGIPSDEPTLVAVTNTVPISLYYSWNGATEVVSYTVTGGASPLDLTPLAVQLKTGFENSTALPLGTTEPCFFRVTPYDNSGQPNIPSNTVYLGDSLCPTATSIEPSGPVSRTLVLTQPTGPMTVSLALEADTVTTATLFVLAQQGITESSPPGETWVGNALSLSGFAAESFAVKDTPASVTFAKPVSISIDYGMFDFPSTNVLRLVTWDPVQQRWSSDGVPLIANDSEAKQATATVSVPGLYALLATQPVYLPTVSRLQ